MSLGFDMSSTYLGLQDHYKNQSVHNNLITISLHYHLWGPLGLLLCKEYGNSRAS